PAFRSGHTAHLNQSLLFPQSLRPTVREDCPAPLVDVIRRCWDPEPDKRPTAVELQGMIENLVRHFQAHGDEWNRAEYNGPPISRKEEDSGWPSVAQEAEKADGDFDPELGI